MEPRVSWSWRVISEGCVPGAGCDLCIPEKLNRDMQISHIFQRDYLFQTIAATTWCVPWRPIPVTWAGPRFRRVMKKVSMLN